MLSRYGTLYFQATSVFVCTCLVFHLSQAITSNTSSYQYYYYWLIIFFYIRISSPNLQKSKNVKLKKWTTIVNIYNTFSFLSFRQAQLSLGLLFPPAAHRWSWASRLSWACRAAWWLGRPSRSRRWWSLARKSTMQSFFCSFFTA